MGTSYVEFHNRGYWTHDVFLEGLSYLLAREFSKLNVKDEWQTELIDKWTVAATTSFVGCVPSYFEDFDTHDKVQLLRETLINIQKQLKENSNFLTVCELNENSVGEGGWIELNLNLFLNIAKLTLDLIDGQLKSNASSPINYWDID